MEATRWKKIEEIFLTVCTLSSGKRREYLDELCQEDDELCQEIIDLLEQDDSPHSLLDNPLKKCELLKVFEIEPHLFGNLKFKL